MNFDASSLFLLAAGYLFILFLVAQAAERGWISNKIIEHPAIYVLSLGVFVSTFGAVSMSLPPRRRRASPTPWSIRISV